MFRTLLNILLALIFYTANAYSQDKNYARSVIDTLCSPSMHGRGYVKKGDGVAARFLKNEFIQYVME